jgi:hypothetical protein
MSRWPGHKLAALAVAAALVATLLALVPGSSSAANLTGSNYTYVINGEEATFPFDPINRQDGLLVPVEVFQRFGISIEGALTRQITFRKADVTAQLTLGSTAMTLNEKPQSLPTAPLRLGGRLFIPADLLRHFGVEYKLDNNILVLRDYAEGQPTVKEYKPEEVAAMKQGLTFTASVKTDSNIFLDAEFTLLTKDLLTASALDLSYGTRARLQSLIDSYTLVMVKLSNHSFKAGAIQTSGLFLVDDLRNQYDVVGTVDFDSGSITGKIAPGADRVGVLVFPKVAPKAKAVFPYYDLNGSSLGTFWLDK